MLPVQLLKCSRVKVRLDCFVFPPACCFTAVPPYKRRRWCCTNFYFQPTRLVAEVCFCFVVLLDWNGKRMFGFLSFRSGEGNESSGILKMFVSLRVWSA